ncbi:hypothetical protein R1sor_003168 [Riccia sorocarpa]|uniref:SAP domain-containing protein n=1 Tax=Riccia sorocarpa TaxID=122646 RepID=A0ABD3H2H6_9MARC
MDYSSLTVKKLQQLCKEQGLPPKGNKKDLVEMLEKLQKPAIELLVESLPPFEDAEDDEIILPVEVAEDDEVAEEEPVPAPIEENITSDDAGSDEPAPVVPELAFTLPARVSARIRRPRICTMCPGTHYHPTHAPAGRVNRKATTAAAVVDDVSIGELAEKLAAVNIVSQKQQLPKDEAEPVKPSVKVSTKSRTATVKVRAPLRARSNQVTVETEKTAGKEDAKPVQKDVKADGKSRSKASGKAKMVSVKEISAAESGKENVQSVGAEADKVPVQKVFERRGRSGKSIERHLKVYFSHGGDEERDDRNQVASRENSTQCT